MSVSTEGQRAIQLITQFIAGAYQRGDRILLLLPGGSAAKLIEPLFSALAAYQTQLTVSLTDERYVDRTSPDSNWHAVVAQCKQLPSAMFIPVLTGANRASDSARLNALFTDFANDPSARIVMLLGMGEDGHTSGIKPHSVATDSHDFVCDYQGPDFQRITTTNVSFSSVDLAVIYTEGESKTRVVADFSRDLSPLDMPAQFVKRAKDYALVYQP